MWKKIVKESNNHGYMSGIDRQSDRVKATGEVFTPTELVIEIIRKMMDNDPNVFSPGKTVFDPACGDGQFLVPVKLLKMYHYGMTESEALQDIYGVDIMRDNVDLCKLRLGGGNIVMGNTLNPFTRLHEQTEEEYRLIQDWFNVNTLPI